MNTVWGDLSCTVTAFDADHRVIGSLALQLETTVQQEVAQTQGPGWKLRVEEQLRTQLQALLSLRYR